MSNVEKIDIGAGEVFGSTLEAFETGHKVVVHQGGTGSGKTYDLMLYLIFCVLMKRENQVITIVSESKPHLDIGVIRYLKTITQQLGIFTKDSWNISKSIFKYEPTGSLIEFFSADRIEKALGARRDWLYGNEVNSLKLEVWEELARRSENIIADFNPTSQFWLEDWIRYYDHSKIIKSNYLDNPFLSDTERGRIEKRAARDNNFRRVHIDCEYGIFEGLVFEGFTLIDEMPNEDYRFGLDWGFTNDPSAIVKVIETPDEIYADELLYRTGMLNRDIITFLEGSGIKKNYDVIVADSAEPKSIKELHMAGFNILPAVKGPDSIRKGIDIIKSKKLFVTKRSLNLIKELRNYSWQLDKEGKATNKPIDANNHLIDSLRYSLTTPKKQPRFMKPL
jgi:phage terminase large subunit